jgi:hypothetical protein
MLEMIIIIEGRMGHEIKITRDSLEINRVEKDFFHMQAAIIVYIPRFFSFESFLYVFTFVWFLRTNINMKELSNSHTTAINSSSKQNSEKRKLRGLQREY